MLKNTLIKCAMLLDRDDIIEVLKQTDKLENITNNLLKNDIEKLINYYNFITNYIFDEYVFLTRKDEVVSSSDGRIYLANFFFSPTKIVSAKRNGREEKFEMYNEYIQVYNPNVRYEIEYRFLPEVAKDLTDEPYGIRSINQEILVFGIVSKYLAGKSKYNESEYFYNKFMHRLFGLKCKRERRLKPHFAI